MNLYERLFRTLNEEGVRYLVVGGVAVNLYGIERATGDVDLLVDLEENNLRCLIKTAKLLDLTPRAPVEMDLLLDPVTRRTWIEEKGMMAFSLYDSVNSWFQVDILIHEPVDFNESYNGMEKMNLDGIAIPVASIKALVAMKENTGRPQDEADTVYLKKILTEFGDE